MITRSDVDPNGVLNDRECVLAALVKLGRVNSLEIRRGGISGNPSERVRELLAQGYPVEVRGNVEVDGRRARLYVWTGTGTGVGRASQSATATALDRDPASAPQPAPAGRTGSGPGANSTPPGVARLSAVPAPGGTLFDLNPEPRSAFTDQEAA